MSVYTARVHLSNDFRRTCMGRDLEMAALDGCYDGPGFEITVHADSHAQAAEIVFRVCNLTADELGDDDPYRPVAAAYRRAGNRSLSVGDMIYLQADPPHGDDGRYVCRSVGFERLS